MNCKQGDLAVVVRSANGNEGKVVTCVRLVDRPQWYAFPGPVWQIAESLPGSKGKTLNLAADCQLRPIRDNDGEDETLTWAGKPQEVTA